MFAQVFAPGDLPASSSVVAKYSGVKLPSQVDIKARHTDGTVRMALVAVLRPELAARSSVELKLARGSALAELDVNLSNISTQHTFFVDYTIQGQTTQRSDVLSALRTALTQGRASFWRRGPLATQARVEFLLPGSLRFLFDVTAFRGGGLMVDALFNNDRAMEAVGGPVTYTVVASMNGREVLRESVTQRQYQNWHRKFSSNHWDGGQNLGHRTAG